MYVRDCMTKNVRTCGEKNTVLSAVSIMAAKNIGAIVVVNHKNEPIGMFTERDLLVRVVAERKDPQKVKVGDVMTRRPLVVEARVPLGQAHHTMMGKGIRHLPVVKGKKVVGMISERVISKVLEDQLYGMYHQHPKDFSGRY